MLSPSTPRATYRLQFTAQFPLAAARELVPYLDRLGVSHVYSSPLLKARTGSAHGYDVVDPTQINPEIGTERDLQDVVRILRRHGMGLILDIVPNHMAVGHENLAWDDVLTHGRASRFASWFDIDWASPSGLGGVVLPVLGDTAARVLARGEVKLVYAHGTFRIHYFEHSFPIDPATLPAIIDGDTDGRLKRIGSAHRDVRELEAIVRSLRRLPARTVLERAQQSLRDRESKVALRRLATLCARSAPIRAHVAEAVARLGRPVGRARLRSLLGAQVYRLVYWRRAGQEVNYRRFFNVNDVVGGLLDGVRIDHVDGLLDPAGYLERLRTALARATPRARTKDFPIYVEKIVSPGERLPDVWPVQGTTGYEFIATLEPVLLDPDGVATIEKWYSRTIAARTVGSDFGTLVVDAKRHMLEGELAADVGRLCSSLTAVAKRRRSMSGLSTRDLTRAIVEVIADLSQYRTYIDGRTSTVEKHDRGVIESAVAAAQRRGRAKPAALDLLQEMLLLGRPANGPMGGTNEARRTFAQRFQQTSSPAMAKGLEDTALYVWVPLASRNEVGGSPNDPVDAAPSRFHAANSERAACWPASLLSASTHDTKRSADVRARLDVISEVATTWTHQVGRWHRLNRRYRRRVHGRLAPDRNTEYLFYQTLVGIWPLRARGHRHALIPGPAALRTVCRRITAYMRKAAREGKVRTSWTDPDRAFEAALDEFIMAVLDPAMSSAFLGDVARFVALIARPGLWNALATTLVHLTAPGVPDVYQGDEMWNFALVDPDNRRPVDFEQRRTTLATFEVLERRAGRRALVRELVQRPEDGRIKLFVTRCTLGARRQARDLFASSGYEPIAVDGPQANHIVAFVRQLGDRAVITVVPRRVVALIGTGPGAYHPSSVASRARDTPIHEHSDGRHLRASTDR
jgi:(1->4)-alpha-D-glucan 1-alpha-D-glucosylmutase